MFHWDGKVVRFNVDNETGLECYNEGIEPSDHGEDVDMAHQQNLEQVEGLEPIASRKTHPWGMVDLYPPRTDPSEWGDHDWTIVTALSDDGPIYAEVPADKAYAYFERPWSIPKKLYK